MFQPLAGGFDLEQEETEEEENKKKMKLYGHDVAPPADTLERFSGTIEQRTREEPLSHHTLDNTH